MATAASSAAAGCTCATTRATNSAPIPTSRFAATLSAMPTDAAGAAAAIRSAALSALSALSAAAHI